MLLREEPATIHAQALPWIDRALFTPLIDARIARDVAHELLRRPWRMMSLLVRTAWEARGSLNALGGVLAFFPKSVSLGRRLRELGAGHVHAHFATHPGHAARVMSQLGGDDVLPFSMTAHAHDIFVTQAGLRGRVRAASFTRCISAFNARFLQELLGPRDAPASELPVIHCGIEPEKYTATAATRPIPPLRLLCIAALKPYKGVAHLVDAVALARAGGLDVTCRVLGAGPLRDELEARIRAASLGAAFELAGTRTQDEVTAELTACDALVLPSVVAADGQMEGIPVALMEALAAGVPVVATRISGIPELVRHAETGFLVEPGDAAALASSFGAIAADPAGARRLAARGAELVRREFALDDVVSRLAAQIDAHGASLGEGGAGSLARIAARALGLGDTARIVAPEGARIVAPGGARIIAPEGARIGVSRVSRGRDALVAELLLPAAMSRDGSPRRVIAKRHLEREGASAPAGIRARREHDALTALCADGLSVPRALAFDEASATVVMERVEGVPASGAFRRARRDLDEALRVAGAAWFWISELRRAHGPRRDEAAFHADAVIARLRRELSEDAGACIARGLPARLVRSLQARCHRELPESVPHETCWSHGDFWPGNVIVDARSGWDVSRITVIDLEGLQPGLPLEDAANFLEHVALALPSILSASRFDRAREEIESVMLVGHGTQATIPQPLRAAKALRLAARSPGLVSGPRRHRALLRARIIARLLEVRS